MTVVVTLVGMELVRSATGLPRVLARMGSMASTTRWRFVPCLPRSVGFLPVSWPPGAGTAAESSAARSQSMRSAWAALREASGAACASTSSVPTPHLGRQVLPGDARLQHEQDPRQRRPVRHPGPSALGLPAAPAGAAARSAPRTHQATVPSPWHPPPWLLFCFLGCLRDGFVRRT